LPRLAVVVLAEPGTVRDDPSGSRRCQPVRLDVTDLPVPRSPDIPGERADHLLIEGTAGGLERELDLAMVVALVKDKELEEVQRVREVLLEGLSGFNAGLDRLPQTKATILKPRPEPSSINGTVPLQGRDRSGELGSILLHRAHALVVHVCKHGRHAGAVRQGASRESFRRNRAEQPEHGGLMAIPGRKQGIEKV
jgi:hypothetical protein